MPITPCQAYNDLKGKVNTWQGGHFRVQSFEYALYEAGLEIFNELRKEWEQSQAITDGIRPFFKRAQIPIIDFSKGGIVPYPADYAGFSGIKYLSKSKNGGKGVKCNDIDVMNTDQICRPLREEEKAELLLTSDDLYERDIQKIDSQRWGSVVDHEFLSPSLEEPYCTQSDGGFRVLPKQIGVVILYYLAIPPRPIFAYTLDARHNIICDPTRSTDLLFGQEMVPEIMARVKTKYASFTGNEQKYAEGSKETQSNGT